GAQGGRPDPRPPGRAADLLRPEHDRRARPAGADLGPVPGAGGRRRGVAAMRRWLLFSIALAAAALAASLYPYTYEFDRLPERVPTHWGISGEPNAWVPRDNILPYLLIFPGVMAGWVVLTLVLPWVSPVHFKVDEFRPTYDYVMALAQVLFAYLHGAILA